MDAEEGSELSEYVQSLTLRDRDKKKENKNKKSGS